MSVAACLSSIAVTCRVTFGIPIAPGTSRMWLRTMESEPIGNTNHHEAAGRRNAINRISHQL